MELQGIVKVDKHRVTWRLTCAVEHMTELNSRISDLLAQGDVPRGRGLHGDLADVSLGSVLSFLGSERRTGRLRLVNGLHRAALHLVQGGVTADEAEVFALLEWRAGHFEFVPSADERGNAQLDPIPVQFFLLEYARRTDEDKGKLVLPRPPCSGRLMPHSPPAPSDPRPRFPARLAVHALGLNPETAVDGTDAEDQPGVMVAEANAEDDFSTLLNEDAA